MDRKCDAEMELDRSVITLKSICYKAVLLFILGILIAPAANAGDMKIFSNTNKNRVYNFKAPTFKLTRPMVITRIDTYHWNNQQGAPPGKIGIKGVGSWRAQGWPGMYNTPNANWTVRPNVRLEPGVYTIVDSDPVTWSQNSGSRGAGFAEVFGRPISSQPSQSANSGSVNILPGKWGSNWGDLQLRFEGDNLIFDYLASEHGKMIAKRIGPGKYKGRWAEDKSNKRCSIAWDNRHYWGNVTITFTSPTNFEAQWGYCNGAQDQSKWKGHKVK